MRRAFASLTFRGKGLLAAGAGIAAGSALAGQRDLLRLALILLALPLGAAYLAARTRFRLGCQRQITPRQLPVGTAGEVDLAVTNLSGRRTGTLLLSDRVPPDLGSPAHRILERVEPGGTRSTTYPLHATRRGRYAVGPLSVTAVDPFGLVRLTRSFTASDPLLVVPAIVHFPDAGLRADHRGHGDGSALTMATRGHDDVVPREYRHGDDLRRIHWRASARAGELMVRREEVPWSNQASVVVDLRRAVHGGDGPTSSLEVTVSAAASAAVHLLRHGWQVRLISTDGSVLVPTSAGAEGEVTVLDALAVARTSEALDIAPGVTRGDLVIAVVAADTRAGSAFGGRAARAPGQLGLAFVVDTAAWWGQDARPAPQVAGDLTTHGWRAAVVGARAGDIERAWLALTSDGLGRRTVVAGAGR